MEQQTGIQNNTVTLENSLAVSYRVKHPPTIQPNNSTPRYSPQIIKNIILARKPVHNCL